MSFKDKIIVYIKAKYPLMWLETIEEIRVIEMLESVSQDLNKNFAIWSLTSGLRKLDKEPIGENTQDPISALKVIQAYKDPLVVVMKDLHRVLDTNNVVYRELRDMYESMKATNKTLFIISPIVKIPIELSKSITVLTLPLPEKNELEGVLQGIMDGLEECGKNGDERKQKAFEHTTEQLAHNGTKDAILSAGMGLSLNEYEDVLNKSLVEKKEIDVSVIVSEKEQIIKKAGSLEFYSAEKLANMDDVGGMDVLKDWIRKRKKAYGEKAKAFGLKSPKGALAIGFPGTGKSLLAKAVAKYMGMPLLRLDMSDVASKWYGETTNKIKLALNLACAVSPVVFWWDEVEKMFGDSGQGTHEETMRAMSTILTWMQELDKDVFIFATCNDPDKLHPALMRAGRFDEVFYVDLPNQTEREEIFRIHIRKAKRNPDEYDNKQFASQTPEYTGAEIEAVVQDAMNNAFYSDSELTNELVLKSIKTIVPLSKKRKAELEKIRKWGKENALSANKEDEVVTSKKKKVGRDIDLN